MKVLAALRDNAANYYRVQAPFMVLKRMGAAVTLKSPVLGDVDDYDVLWLHMHADANADIIAHEFKRAGKVVVYDVDDDLWDMPPSWTGYDQFFNRGTLRPTERMLLFERGLGSADLVTTTTEYLAAKLRARVAVPVVTLPNCVMMGDWDILLPTQHGRSGPVLGWFGTGNHWEDWLEIAPLVDTALAHVDGYLALMGAPEVVTCFPERLRQRTLISPLVPMQQFDAMRRLIKACDVGLAWVTDRLEAAKCRSPLKALQWGAAGVSLVASATVYGEVLHDSYYVPATLENLESQLLAALTSAVKERQQLAQHWQAQVWHNYSYELQSQRWLNLLNSKEFEHVAYQ